MKKRLASLLCAATCLTGCSQAEMSYLNMGRDMLTASGYEVTGQLQVKMDADVMQKFLADTVQADSKAVEMNKEMFNNKTAILDYEMQMDTETSDYCIAFKLNYDGKVYDLGTVYYSLTEGIHVSSDTIWSIYELAKTYNTEYKDSFICSDGYGRELKQLLDTSDYIKLFAVDGIEDAAVEQDFYQLYESAVSFYKKAMDGFETGLVTEIENGYRIKANGMDAMTMVTDLLDFMATHPEQVLDAFDEYINTASIETMVDAIEPQPMTFDVHNYQNDFVETTTSISAIMKSMMTEDGVNQVLNSLEYDGAVQKNGAGYCTNSVFKGVHHNEEFFNFTAEATLEAADVTLQFPTDSMPVEEMKDKITALNQKYNPVTGVMVSWLDWSDTNMKDATVEKMYAEDLPLNAMEEYAIATELLLQDGKAYLPLRIICDELNENVTWNNQEKVAYVNGVALKGILQDGKSYVAVRDFEKLGYTVDYYADGEDGFKFVEITKN